MWQVTLIRTAEEKRSDSDDYRFILLLLRLVTRELRVSLDARMDVTMATGGVVPFETELLGPDPNDSFQCQPACIKMWHSKILLLYINSCKWHLLISGSNEYFYGLKSRGVVSRNVDSGDCFAFYRPYVFMALVER